MHFRFRMARYSRDLHVPGHTPQKCTFLAPWVLRTSQVLRAQEAAPRSILPTLLLVRLLGTLTAKEF